MISRCYDITDQDYKNYGEKGVTVCKEWHTFSNYVKDIEAKENYDKLLKDKKNWEIDKDILIPGNKLYSNETTLIVPKCQNVKERILRQGTPTKRKRIIQKENNVIINEFESICDASKQTGVNRCAISHCCNGRAKTAGGYTWQFK